MEAHIIKIGDTIGRLIVISKSDRTTKNGSKIFICRCICGTIKEYISGNLIRSDGKNTKSCGCLAIEKSSLPDGEASFNYLELTGIHNAKNRGYIYNLTKQQFRELVTKPCYYCGFIGKKYSRYANKRSKGLTQAAVERSWITVNGIDRKDNTIGYILDNCLSCCEDCNFAKRNMTYDRFIAYINRLMEFRK